jgi:tripartite-type tricarboxylate transporter receptor subunit TctC
MEASVTTTRSRMVAVTLITLLATAGLAAPPTAAQEAFPTRPITVWVGFPPGGATDILMRALAEGAEKSLGQKVVVINKPGAAGAVATAELVKAKPDGYTILCNTDTPVTRSPHLRDLEYDPFRDLTFINRVGTFKVVFAIRADSPHRTWRDVVEWAKKNPGQLTLGHPGVATTPALVMTRFAAKDGFTFRGVPFAGDGPSVSALLGGHVVLLGGSSVAVSSYVQAKRMRALLVNDKEGLDYAPEAVSFEKAGYDVESTTAVITFGPRGMPRPVVDRLAQAFQEAAKTETFVNIARKSEVTVGEPLTGQALADWLRKVGANYEDLIKQAGLYKTEKRP